MMEHVPRKLRRIAGTSACGVSLLMAPMASCSNGTPAIEEGLDPASLGIQRSYTLSACTPAGSALGQPPCQTHATAAYTRYLDSARVVLTPDRAASVMLSFHDRSCPCYMGGCNDPCAHEDPRVDRAVGTYSFEATRLRIAFADNSHLNWSGDLIFAIEQLPSRVPRTWLGPDSLGYATGILRP